MFLDDYLPWKVLNYLPKVDRDYIAEHTEVVCELLVHVSGREYNVEIDFARKSQIISVRLQAPKYISVLVIRICHCS